MKIIDAEQNSPEWIKARLGKITASGMHNIITPLGARSKASDRYIRQLMAEVIREEPSSSFQGNVHTERGHQLEEEAANYYAMLNGVDPIKVGFCLTDDEMIGASPDRFIGEDGILEIKTCLPEIMIEQYEKETLEQSHRPQTQCQLFVTGRKWVDTMLYCPKMRPIIVRSERNTPFIMDMVSFATDAHRSMQNRLAALKEKGYYEP